MIPGTFSEMSWLFLTTIPITYYGTMSTNHTYYIVLISSWVMVMVTVGSRVRNLQLLACVVPCVEVSASCRKLGVSSQPQDRRWNFLTIPERACLLITNSVVLKLLHRSERSFFVSYIFCVKKMRTTDVIPKGAKLPLGVNYYAHDALWAYYWLTPSIPGMGFGSTMTLTRTTLLLKSK